MNTTNFPGVREARQKESLERQVAWAKLTPAQQLQELDRRLGVGVGAKRQRERLAKAKTAPVVEAAAAEKPKGKRV